MTLTFTYHWKRGLARLDALADLLEYLPLTMVAMRRAVLGPGPSAESTSSR
jgi:hypothetical protein